MGGDDVQRMHPEDLEALAELVTGQVLAALDSQAWAATPEAQLVTADVIARRIGVSAAWVRAHADELGAIRLGTGSRPRLRFDPQRAVALAERGVEDIERKAAATHQPRRRKKPRAARTKSVRLLPIRSSAE